MDFYSLILLMSLSVCVSVVDNISIDNVVILLLSLFLWISFQIFVDILRI